LASNRAAAKAAHAVPTKNGSPCRMNSMQMPARNGPSSAPPPPDHARRGVDAYQLGSPEPAPHDDEHDHVDAGEGPAPEEQNRVSDRGAPQRPGPESRPEGGILLVMSQG
jgi:hypothetical protein